jgi:hypothetical protein
VRQAREEGPSLSSLQDPADSEIGRENARWFASGRSSSLERGRLSPARARGANPKGILILAENRAYASIIVREEVPIFAAKTSLVAGTIVLIIVAGFGELHARGF